MSEMIERVARAMKPTTAKLVDRLVSMGADPKEAVTLLPLEAASAAIGAMREPTEAMIDAGVSARSVLYARMEDSGVDTTTMLVAKHPAGTIYAAMIDEALK